MPLPRTFPKRQPPERQQPMPAPEPVQRRHTWESSSAAAQTAVRNAGGVQAVVNMIERGFDDTTGNARRTAYILVMAALAGDPVKLTELSRHSPQVGDAFHREILAANLSPRSN